MEHLLAKEGVAGSIPVSRSKKSHVPLGAWDFFVTNERGDAAKNCKAILAREEAERLPFGLSALKGRGLQTDI